MCVCVCLLCERITYTQLFDTYIMRNSVYPIRLNIFHAIFNSLLVILGELFVERTHTHRTHKVAVYCALHIPRMCECINYCLRLCNVLNTNDCGQVDVCLYIVSNDVLTTMHASKLKSFYSFARSFTVFILYALGHCCETPPTNQPFEGPSPSLRPSVHDFSLDWKTTIQL